MLISEEEKQKVSNQLENIVHDFNVAFAQWMERTGCRANFGFKYGAGKELKALEIVSIDAMIYKKPISPTLLQQLSEVEKNAQELDKNKV